VFSYASLFENLLNCPPESTRGPFFFLGGGKGASPDIHEGIAVESKEPVSAGIADFFLPKPTIYFSSQNLQ
jgi:hypothetical protein